MRYFKIMQGNTVLTAEAHESPAFVKLQSKNNIKVRCSEHYAQGIISLNEDEVYQLPGKDAIAGIDKTAVEITMTEYDEIISGYDPEDESPEIPEEDPVQPLTRAELTAKVKALEKRNEFLEDCLLEMSEIVYADDADD